MLFRSLYVGSVIWTGVANPHFKSGATVLLTNQTSAVNGLLPPKGSLGIPEVYKEEAKEHEHMHGGEPHH